VTGLTSNLFLRAAVPGPPAAPEISNILSTSCSVKYQLPVDEGDAQVTGYHVQRGAVIGGAAVQWEMVNSTPITALELIDDQLKPNSEYQFRVAAVNENGMGDFSPPSLSITSFPDPESESSRPSAIQRYMPYALQD